MIDVIITEFLPLPFYSAFTETWATQTMKTNQEAELKQWIPTFSNPANQMPSIKQ